MDIVSAKGKEPIVETAMEANAVVETAEQPATALYVGDLDGSVTEEELKLLFNQIGEVTSVKICMDQTAERSLGYGYVNYGHPQHAAKALQVLNFTHLNGKHIRVAYSNREGSLRKNGLGNIFVKNLDKSIDHNALYDIFSAFGNIISSKVETDSSGISKGYGYIHYDKEEAARNAVDSLNGVLLHGKKLYVAPFISRQDREISVDKTKFTNVFVKNLSESTSEEDLKSTFGEFGPINSVAVMRDEAGNSKCFGFVNFENVEDAARSVEVLNGRVFNGKEWYVGRAQKKSEREQELKLRHEQLAKEALERSLGTNNLYVKNIDDEIDSDKIKELFSPFGTITSCKIMCDPKGISKGYGFIAFATGQQASRAISEMNGKMVGSKPLYVGIAERKDARRQRLQSVYSNMRPTTVVPPVTPHMHMYHPGTPGVAQQIFYGHVASPILPHMPGYGYQQQLVPGLRHSGTLIPNVLFPVIQRGSEGPRPSNGRPGQQSVSMMHQQIPFRGNAYRLQPGHGFSNLSAHVTSAAMLSSPQEISSLSMHDPRMRWSIPVGILASALANVSPSEQRTMLGENLYPLVEQLEPDIAGKVTGMLLEMDQTEVLHLLESRESLRAKVVEAMEVIRNAPQQRRSSPSDQLASLYLN